MSRRLRAANGPGTLLESSHQETVELHEQNIQRLQEQCFQGEAVVRLADLATCHDWWHLIDDGGNVARLSRILETQGCLRIQKQYHIPVIINSRDWSSNVFYQEKTLAPNLHLPQLATRNGYLFAAIDHRSLIAAAGNFFDRLGVTEPWWVIDIFLTGSDQDLASCNKLRQSLQNRFQNDSRPSDGQIYRNIRFCQQTNDQIAETYWWAILEAEPGSRKGEYLRSLPDNLQSALDALLPITGIWNGMNIGVLHKLRAMKCDEASEHKSMPLICYLKRIQQTFLSIVNGQSRKLYQIDAKTVKLIQSRAPKVSADDLRHLEEEWSQQNLFRFLDVPAREGAWTRLIEIDFLIPTLETFFNDVLYLDVGRTVMRQLCLTAPIGEGTIDRSLKSQYIGYPSNFISPQYWDEMVVNGCLYDLWRFSLQYAFELTSNREHRRRVPRKSRDKSRAVEFGLNEWQDVDPLSLLHDLLTLAVRYDFQIPFYENPISQDIEPPSLQPCDFPPDAEEDVDLERRSGKPFTDSIAADRFALSREALGVQGPEHRISAGFTRRCVFRAFFSYLSPTPEASAIDPLAEMNN